MWHDEELLDVMWYIDVVGVNVEASILLDPTVVEAQEFTISTSMLGEGRALLPG